MRLLLISANVEKLPDPVAPLGLACLCSALKGRGHDVHCLDLCFEDNIEGALEKSLSNFSPEGIGLSVRNVDNVSYPHTVSYLPFYRKLVERCRQLSRAPIFLGGSGFTLMPQAILRYLDADGGVIGEGEEAFPKALTAIAGDSTPPIDGWIRRGSGHSPRPAWVEDLDSLPPPDWSGLDVNQYFSRGGMGNLQTKRGCPFRCIYCTYPLIEGQKLRLRSPEKVAQDAASLIRLGVTNAFIVDNIFNYPESHAQEVCRAFIRKGIPLKWSCYAHPAHFSRALAENMRKAGCTGVEFGTDSGSPAVLARLGKDFTPEDIQRASLCAREAGLEVCHSLSLGAPGETEETLQETTALMEKISPTAVVAMLGLRIFPGTGLARLAGEEGMIAPTHDFLQPTFYLAPQVRGKVVEVAHQMAPSHPNWIFPGLGINVSSRLQSKLRKFGVKGPLWEHMKILRERRAARKEPNA
jgi:radical SAM superfamily enzyme YgiQ (UPF0313 family)